MGAITNIVFKKRIPLNAAAGGLVGEVWTATTSTDGDTQTLALRFVKTVLSVTGPVCYTAQTADYTLDVITTSTIDSGKLTDIIIIGTE